MLFGERKIIQKMNMNYQTETKPTSINIDICKGKKFELKNLSRICNSKCKLDLNNNGNVTQQINNNKKKTISNNQDPA